MEKDYYKRYWVSLNPESDKDKEIIDYLEKFSSGSSRMHALKELLYNGLHSDRNDIADILESINKQLYKISTMKKVASESLDYSDHTAEIYEIFSKEYEPELKKYNSKMFGFKDEKRV